MRHFVQYHNPARMGSYVYKARDGFGISTDKPVDSLRGDRIWLVTRDGSPPRYRLCETFIVEEVDRLRSGAQRNQVFSRSGKAFLPPIPIDSASWFQALQRTTGNFAFGLQHIKSRAITAGLLRLATNIDGDGDTHRQQLRPIRSRHGAGLARQNTIGA